MLAVRAFLKSLSKAHVVSGIACSPGTVDSQEVIGVMPGILKIRQIDIGETVGVIMIIYIEFVNSLCDRVDVDSGGGIIHFIAVPGVAGDGNDCQHGNYRQGNEQFDELESR